MNAIELQEIKLKKELKEFQDEFIIISKTKRQLKYRIECKLEEISKLLLTDKLPNTLLNRDIDLCVEFIRTHKNVTSGDLIVYLNQELKDKEIRWNIKKPLDSNYFMSRIGSYLKINSYITTEIGVGAKNKPTTIWKIK